MSKVLLDTDVLIDHLRGHRRLDKDNTAAVSVITRTELYAGDEREENAVDALLKDYEEVAVDASIARRAGRIKRHTGLQIADALIAATALEHGLPVMTRNIRHFERVAGLTLQNSDGLAWPDPGESDHSQQGSPEPVDPPS